jgi:hypothetical protein
MDAFLSGNFQTPSNYKAERGSAANPQGVLRNGANRTNDFAEKGQCTAKLTYAHHAACNGPVRGGSI